MPRNGATERTQAAVPTAGTSAPPPRRRIPPAACFRVLTATQTGEAVPFMSFADRTQAHSVARALIAVGCAALVTEDSE